MATLKHSTPKDRNKAKRLYMDGWAYTAISKEIGFSTETIGKWSRDKGWKAERAKRQAEEAQAFIDETPDVTFDTIGVAGPESVTIAAPVQVDLEEVAPVYVPDESSQAEIDRLTLEVQRLRDQNAALIGQVDEMSPTRDISLMLQDPIRWIAETSPEGDSYWRSRAEATFAKENTDRAKQGLPPFNLNDHPDMLDDIIARLQQEMLDARNRPIEDLPAKSIKMLIVRNGVPTIEQIPYEPTINNMNGSLADPIVRYQRKGFKMTAPLLCLRRGCFAAASLDEFGRFSENGYCGSTHRREIEGASVDADRATTPIATMATAGGYG
jgi:hypothetical protein